METITNTIQKNDRATLGTSAMVALSIGVAVAFAMGFATPPKAQALIVGPNCCGGSSYGTKPVYKNYSYKPYSSTKGYSNGGGWSNFLNGLTINWHDNSDSNNTNITNTTNNNTNVNTNVNGNDNYIGGVAVSTQTNTDISSWTSANYNQPNYVGGVGGGSGYGYGSSYGGYSHYRLPTYIGGAAGSNQYSSNDFDNDNGNQNNNFNVNFGSHDDDDDDDNDNNDNSDIACDLDVSDTSVDEGDRITLSWDTEGDVDEARINQGIGSVDEDGGSLRFTVDDEDVTFRMTVEDNDGDEATCSVFVNVDGDNNDNDFSSAVFTDEPPQNPSQVVYLSSIPYTGLDEVTPEILAYWLLLIAGALGMVWFALSKGMLGSFALATTSGALMHSEDTEGEAEEETESNVSAFVSALALNEQETAVEYLRSAAVDGTGVEEFLEEARASVADTDPVASRLDAAIAESRMTGIRGAKAALAA